MAAVSAGVCRSFRCWLCYRTYNYGVAFSMLSGMEGWFIVGMRLVVVAFVIWLWRRTPKDRFFAHLGYAMIIAGAHRQSRRSA